MLRTNSKIIIGFLNSYYIKLLAYVLLQFMSIYSINTLLYSAEKDKSVKPTTNVELLSNREYFAKPLDELITNLSNTNENIIIKSIEILGERSEEKAVPYLVKLVDNPDNRVRERLALSLGEIGVREGISALLALAKDKDEDVQLNAIYSLGKIGDEEAVPVLLELLDCNNTRIICAAIRSLGDIGAKEAVSVLIEVAKKHGWGRGKESSLEDSWIKCRQEAILSLGRIGVQSSEIVQTLKELLQDEVSGIRKNASYAFCLLAPKDAVDVLVEAIKKKDFAIMINIKYALKIIHTQEAIEKLKDLYINSKDTTVSLIVIEILSSMEDDMCYQALMQAVEDKDILIQKTAIIGLGKLRNKEAIPKLCEILKNNRADDLRADASVALGIIQSPESLNYLLSALEDSNKDVQDKAIRSIINLGDKSVIPIFKQKIEDMYFNKTRTGEVQQDDMYKGSHIKKKTTPKTIGEYLIGDIIRCIAVIGGKEESQYIYELMCSKNSKLRESAVLSSGFVGGEKITEKLIDIAKNKTVTLWMRTKAIDNLGMLGNQDAVKGLVSLLNDDDREILLRSIGALSRLKSKECVPQLISLLNHKEEAVRVHSMNALTHMGIKDAFQKIYENAMQKDDTRRLLYFSSLANLLNENSDYYNEILQAFVVVLSEEFPKIRVRGLLLTKDTKGKHNANEKMGSFYCWHSPYEKIVLRYSFPPPSSTLVEDIISSEEDIGDENRIDRRDSVRWSVEGLLMMKDPKSRVLLERALMSPHEDVRMHAARALGKLGDSHSFIPLVYYTQDITPWGRSEVIEALGKIKTIKAFPFIRIVAFDEYASNKEIAIQSLGEIKSEESLQLLRWIFKNEKNNELWMYEAESIYMLTGELSDEVKNKILQNLVDTKLNIRLTAVRMCKNMNIHEAKGILKNMVETEPVFEIRKTAQEAYDKL